MRLGDQLRGAWETLSDIKLPKFLAEGERTDDGGMLFWFPLLGALCGGALALGGALCSLLTNRIAGAAVFALASLAFMVFKDSGRGMTLLTSFLRLRIERGSFAAALTEVSSARTLFADPLAVGIAAILALAEFAVLFLLCARGSALFLAAVLAGAFAAQGILAAGDADSEPVPLIKDEDNAGRRRMVISSVVVALVLFAIYPVATAFSVALFCAVAFGFSGMVRREAGAPTPDLVTLGGALTEAGLLACGFLWTL